MPFYQNKGTTPAKRHTVFKLNNKLCFEELVSREGFSSMYSNLYHLHMPTTVKKVGKFHSINISKANTNHQPHHFKTFNEKKTGNAVDSRVPLLFNNDIIISTAIIDKKMDYFYRNGHFDELLYVQYGKGLLSTNYGDLCYKEGDYIIIPRGVIWQLIQDETTKLLVIESTCPIETPSKYRNKFGQLLEGSPYCERDILVPTLKDPINILGDFLVKVRVNGGIQDYIYDHHPFDVVGWDGYYFPWIFNINDFEPIVGSIHQPPPVHQTYESKNFVVCSFVNRLFDFHKDAIPAPYPHSNVDSDEVIFYSLGDFMSRKGISTESITYHPMGLPHGPQPGKYEESIGKKKTEELAVMIDTFNPLNLTKGALNLGDNEYPLSWKK